jgi:hypothetical protein
MKRDMSGHHEGSPWGHKAHSGVIKAHHGDMDAHQGVVGPT